MLELIQQRFEDEYILCCVGYDKCIIGYEFKDNIRLIYSVKRIINQLIEEGLTEEEAYEHYEFNIVGAWVGEKTPIFCYDDF
jgi:uncharacterized protein YjaZ